MQDLETDSARRSCIHSTVCYLTTITIYR